MIGNAVPVPLAQALGGELLKVLVRQFKEDSSGHDHHRVRGHSVPSVEEEIEEGYLPLNSQSDLSYTTNAAKVSLLGRMQKNGTAEDPIEIE